MNSTKVIAGNARTGESVLLSLSDKDRLSLQDFYYKAIIYVINNFGSGNTNLDSLNAILMPLEIKNLKQQQQEAYQQHSYASIRATVDDLVCDAIISELQNYSFIRQNEALINSHKSLYENTLSKKSKSENDSRFVKAYKNYIEHHQNDKLKIRKHGFTAYRKYENIQYVHKTIQSFEPHNNLDSGSKEEVKTIFDYAIVEYIRNFEWETKYRNLKSNFSIERQIYLNRLYSKNTLLISILDNCSTFSSFKKKLHQKSREYKEIISKYNKILASYSNQPINLEFQENVKQFFANTSFFKRNSKVFIDSLIKEIVFSRDTSLWELDQRKIDSIFDAINKISDKSKRQILLKSFKRHFITSAAYNAASTCIEQAHSNDFTNSTNVTGGDLVHILQDVDCYTEAKLRLKECIMRFLNNYDPKDKITINQVSYLIAALKSASIKGQDVDIIFTLPSVNKTAAAQAQVGISLVLESIKYSSLKKDLEEIILRVKQGWCLYSEPNSHALKSLVTYLEEKAKSKAELKGSEAYQLHRSHMQKLRNPGLNLSPIEKIDSLRQASFYLVQAAIKQQEDAKYTLHSSGDRVVNFNFETLYSDTFIKKSLEVFGSELPTELAYELFTIILSSSHQQFYSTYQTRLQNLIYAFSLFSSNTDGCKREAFHFLLKELLNDESRFDKYFKTKDNNKLKTSHFISLLRTNDLSELIELGKEYLVSENIQDLTASMNVFLNHYHLQNDKDFYFVQVEPQDHNVYKMHINAELIALLSGKDPKKAIVFRDKNTNTEYARISSKDETLKFYAYGSYVELTIDGKLDCSRFYIVNKDGTVKLKAAFENKDLYLGAEAKKLILDTAITTNHSVLIDNQSDLQLGEFFECTADNVNIFSSDTVSQGKIKAFKAVIIDSWKSFTSKAGSAITADVVCIHSTNANLLVGNISAFTNLFINAIANIKIIDNASLYAGKNLIFKSKDMLTSGSTLLITGGLITAIIDNDLNIDDSSKWKASALSLSVKRFENYSPELHFGSADITIKATFTNHPSGIFNTEKYLSLTGESFWNAGVINYGKNFIVTLNKYFVNGVTNIEELQQNYGHPSRLLKRGFINGEAANITALVYFGFLNVLHTHKLSLTALVDIQIGTMRVNTGTYKSRVFSFDVGIDVPNLPAIILDLKTFFTAVTDGNYSAAMNLICTADIFYKSASFARWLVRTFTNLGKPVDMLWTLFSAVASMPDFVSYLLQLANQTAEIENHQYVTVLAKLNSFATQAAYAGNEINTLDDSFLSPILSNPQLTTDLFIQASALLLPYSSSNSFFEFQSGMHIDFTKTDRAFYMFNFGNLDAAINLTRMFNTSVEAGQYIAANSISRIGANLNSDEKSYSGTDYRNVTNEVSSDVVHSHVLIDQSTDSTFTSLSHIHANQVLLNNTNTEVNGSIAADNLQLSTNQAVVTGSVTAHSAAIHANELDARESSDTKVENLTLSTETTTRLAGTIESENLNSQSAGSQNLSGTLNARHVSLSASSVTADAKLHAETLSVAAGTAALGGVTNVVDNLEVSAARVITSGHVKAHVEQLSGSVIQQDGITEADELTAVSDTVIESKGTTEAKDITMQSQDIWVDGQTRAGTEQLNAETIDLVGENTSRSLSMHATHHLAFDGSTTSAHIEALSDHTVSISRSVHTDASLDSNTTPSSSIIYARETINANSRATISVTGTNLTLSAGDAINSAASLHVNSLNNDDNQEPSAAIVIDAHQVTSIGETDGNGTLAIVASDARFSNVHSAGFEINEDHVPDLVDLIQSSGQYQSVSPTQTLSISTDDDIRLTDKIDTSRSLHLTGRSIDVENDLHSSLDLFLDSTVGDVYSRKNVIADRYLAINSARSYTNDQGNLSGLETYITTGANLYNIAGTIAGLNYLQIASHGDVYNTCLSWRDVQGRYDTLMRYQPGTLLGGAGMNHNGVGFNLQADGTLYNSGSYIMSYGSNYIYAKAGIQSTALYNQYCSYYRKYHNFFRTAVTTEYSYQEQCPVIYSQTGSNTLFTDGNILSISTIFNAARENDFSARYDINLLGLVLNTQLDKHNSEIFGLIDRRTHQSNEYAVPTVVVNVENTNIISAAGRVQLLNALVQTPGKLTISADDILISAPVLNHSYEEDNRGFTFSLPALSMLNGSSLFQDYQGFAHSRNGAEYAANSWNALLDSFNLFNSLTSGMRNGSFLQAAFPASYLLSVNMGYEHTHTKIKWQTVADNVGIYAGDFIASARNTLAITNAAPVVVAHDATLSAKTIVHSGARLDSSIDTSTQSVSVGYTLDQKPSFSASESSSHTETATYQNQVMQVGGVLTETASVEIDATNANLRADKIVLTTPTLNLTTVAGTSNSTSQSLSACTNGSVSGSYRQSQSQTIGQRSSIEAVSDMTADIGTANLTGAALTSGGTANLNIETLNGQDVEEYNHTSGVSLSVNLNDLSAMSNPPPVSDSEQPKSFLQALPTANLGVSYTDFEAKQKSTVFANNGTDLSHTHTNGDLNTANANGREVTRNTQFDETIRVPLPNASTLPTFERNVAYVKQNIKPASGVPLPPQTPKPISDNKNEGSVDEKKSPVTSGSKSERTSAPKPSKHDDTDNESESVDEYKVPSSDNSWALQNSSRYAKAAFSQPTGFSVDTSTSQNSSVAPSTKPAKSSQPSSSTEENDFDEKFFDSKQNSASFNTGIPDPRPSSLSFFGRKYYAPMPIAPSPDYAEADLGIFVEKDRSKDGDYASESKFVTNPHSVDLNLSSPTGFRSGTQEYLDQVQLAQPDSTDSAMAYSHEPLGERIKKDAEKAFTMKNVDAFNKGVEATRDRLVTEMTHPIQTTALSVLAVWDGLNAITEATIGATTNGAHERNIERGKSFSLNPVDERFKNYTDQIFTMQSLDAFNEGMEAVRDGLVSVVTNPVPTVESIAQGGWDAVNGISEAACGITTDGAHARNIERGKTIHQSVEDFENGSVADDVRMSTELIAGAVMGEAFGVTLARIGDSALSYVRRSIKLDVPVAGKSVSQAEFPAINSRLPELPEEKEPDAFKPRSLVPTESLDETLGLFPENGETMVDHSQFSIGDSKIDNGTDLPVNGLDKYSTGKRILLSGDEQPTNPELIAQQNRHSLATVNTLDTPMELAAPIDSLASLTSTGILKDIGSRVNTLESEDVFTIFNQLGNLAGLIGSYEYAGLVVDEIVTASSDPLASFSARLEKQDRVTTNQFADQPDSYDYNDNSLHDNEADSDSLVKPINKAEMITEDKSKQRADNVDSPSELPVIKLNESTVVTSHNDTNLYIDQKDQYTIERPDNPLTAFEAITNSVKDLIDVEKSQTSIETIGHSDNRHNFFNSGNNHETFHRHLSQGAFAPGSVGAAKIWTLKARLTAAQLPFRKGKFRFRPPENYINPKVPLIQALTKSGKWGYLDKFKNIWVEGKSRTHGEPFEWDVQLSEGAKYKLKWRFPNADYVNVSLKGRITHG